MRPTDKSRQTVVLCSPFCIIKNTGHGNFVVGRFHTRARKWIIRLRLPCVQSPPPPSPTDTPFQFFSEGKGQLYTGYLEQIIHLQTVRQNWRIKSGGLFIQNDNLSIFKLRRITTYLTRIIKRITPLTRMIRLECESDHFCYK